MLTAITRELRVLQLTDADDLRRAWLIMMGSAAMIAHGTVLAASATAIGNVALAAAVVALVALASIAYVSARRGRLAAAEWAAAALVAASSVALVATQGAVSSRLGMLHVGVVLLGLAARPWMALAQVGLGVALVLAASALGAPLPLAPSTLPVWVGVALQLALATALVMTFTHGYRRLHAALAERAGKLEAAHAALVATRARLEHVVAERTAELGRASQDLEAFSSMVAHDLRAPLRRMRQFLELFTEDADTLDEARLAPIATVQRSAAELTTQIEAILATHRRAAGRS